MARAEAGKDYEVTQTTALGRTTRFKDERLSTGETRKINTSPAGAQTELLMAPTGVAR